MVLKFIGDQTNTIGERRSAVRKGIAQLTGPAIPRPEVPAAGLAPFVADDAVLNEATLNSRKAEAWRVGQLIGLDSSKQKQLEGLNAKIAKNEALLGAVNKNILNAEGAQQRISALILKRKQAYSSLFDGFVSEQDQLTEMYSPLRRHLNAEVGTLGKLTFSVRRVVDVQSWSTMGEGLLNLRTGHFRGRGELMRVAVDTLLPAWESGTSAEVAEAMATFRNEHDKHVIEQAKVPRSDVSGYRKWAQDVSAWLNSTEHVSVSYGVQYDGVDIEQLSPGTRGIVLLLLYLAVDQSDDRPLIIDQPEENLHSQPTLLNMGGR